jgi:MoxR-like ATPase/Mg-chelatase subunit ChlD
MMEMTRPPGGGHRRGRIMRRLEDTTAPGGGVVGRARELELLRAAVAAGRDVLLEGPPGTSKTTMLRAITQEWGVPLIFVEGNADLTTGKLVGHHAPDRVLREGYRSENFVDGPLVEAMKQGGFLYIEELNRSPQDTLNTLLSAIGDRRLTIPRLGTITAQPSFRLIAAMNPFDNVGTMRISMSIYDRLCRLAVDYQDEELEREIVERRAGDAEWAGLSADGRLVRDAVALVRATRAHPDLRHGSSVRGAIDTVLVARQLGRGRDVPVDLPGSVRHPGPDYTGLVLDAVTVALSGRIQLDPAAAVTPEQVLHDIWETHFLELAASPGGDTEVAALTPLQRAANPDAPFRRKPKRLDEPPRLFLPTPDGRGPGDMTLRRRDAPSPADGQRPDPTNSGESDDEGEVQPIPESSALDPEVARRAEEIASRLALTRRRSPQSRNSGRGVLSRTRFDGSSDEIDLEATIDALVAKPDDFGPDDVVISERILHRRAVALLVDISGSMKGERVRTAAATVGALAGEMEDDQLAVIAFWSDAALLLALGEQVESTTLMETLLRLPARGLTNVGFPLEIARNELAGARTPQTRVVLLSDCLHNAGGDPRPLAAGLGRLDILLDVSGEHDLELARELADAGRGRFCPVRTHRDVAPALDVIFGD